MLTLTGTNLLDANSWTKTSTPVFKSGNGIYGPGRASFVKSSDGKSYWMIYHANNSLTIPSGSSWWAQRKIYIKKFTWNSDGTPNFGSPASVNITIPVYND